MDLYTQLYSNIPKGWEELFRVTKPEIVQISELLEKEKSKNIRIVPDQENIFKIFYMCKPEDVKVVILGADPYHQILTSGKPRALGFSFSVSRDDMIPSSLHNIYKEIKNCYPDTVIPNHGDISHWVPQGVLLLNISLTCRANEPNSHAKYRLWMPFIDRVFKYLSNINKDVIFVLWGNEAQKLDTSIEKGFRNILKGVHPSGLSANRGFIGNGHFKTINEMLIKQSKQPIKWLDTLIEEYTGYFLKNIPEEEMESLNEHYKSYYDMEKVLNFSLSEYSLKNILELTYITYHKDKLPYNEYLKRCRDSFETKNKTNFYESLTNFV